MLEPAKRLLDAGERMQMLCPAKREYWDEYRRSMSAGAAKLIEGAALLMKPCRTGAELGVKEAVQVLKSALEKSRIRVHAHTIEPKKMISGIKLALHDIQEYFEEDKIILSMNRTCELINSAAELVRRAYTGQERTVRRAKVGQERTDPREGSGIIGPYITNKGNACALAHVGWAVSPIDKHTNW